MVDLRFEDTRCATCDFYYEFCSHPGRGKMLDCEGYGLKNPFLV